MNLLEFPNEILFEFCKHMDFQTRAGFRQLCKQTHSLLNNPKHIVTKEKVDEWNKKMRMVVGMTLLDNIDDYVIFTSLSDQFVYLRLGIDENYEFFMTTSYRAIHFLRNFKIHNEYYEITDNDTIMIDDTLFSKYKLDKHKNIFDHKEIIGSFLYDLYISFICFDQKKYTKKISRTQLSNLIKIILNHQDKFYHIANQIFRYSSYFVFSDKPHKSQSFFKSNIETITMDLQKDLSRYFMDGEEAEQFLSSYE